MNNKKLLITAMVATLPLSVFASDKTLELSYSKSNGNSDTTSFLAKAKVKSTIDSVSWVDSSIDATYNKSNNVKTDSNYKIESTYNRIINGDLFYYVGATYNKDNLSTSYNYQLSVGPGLGYKVLKGDDETLDVKAGFDYSYDKLINNDSNSYVSFKAEGNYKYKINEFNTFNEIVKYQVSLKDSENYTASSESILTSKLSSNLSLAMSYKIDYANLETPNKTNSKILTSLIVNF